MPMTCSVCSHPQRQSIDAAIASHILSNRLIASQFGIGYNAVQRHKHCLSNQLTKAVARVENKKQDDFLDAIQLTMEVGRRGMSAGMEALEMGDAVSPELAYRMGPSYAAQGLAAARLLGEATGRLNQAAATTTLNVLCVSIPGPPAPQASSPNAIEATSEVIAPGDTEE